MSKSMKYAERATIGRGKYKLSPRYQVWHVPEKKWFTMISAQREKNLQGLPVHHSGMLRTGTSSCAHAARYHKHEKSPNYLQRRSETHKQRMST